MSKKENYDILGDGFKSYLSEDTYKEHKEELINAAEKIKEGLKEYPNFAGVDFCDVSANGGIQVRSHHKEVKGYTFGNQFTIKYDFSNIEEVIKETIEDWKRLDNEKYLSDYQNFLYQGEKWGWD